MKPRASSATSASRRTASSAPVGISASLPVPASRFVGRAAELASLTERVAAGARLVTLVGPPGTGKTRLALRLADALREAKAVGDARFVDLTAARTAPDFLAHVAEVIEAPLTSSADDDAVSRIAARLSRLTSRRSLLLVLDNLEQVVDIASPLVAGWVARVPGLVVLATSREALRADGEQTFQVPPLALPGEGAVLESEAVQLLLARAHQFTPSEDDLVAIAAIVQRLEGIPLAIELAAARLSLMGAVELRDRLARGLDVLGQNRRDAPARQATLRGALDWSWALLSELERRALSVCGLFRGSFSVEAALAAIGDQDGDVLEALQSLREKSLVARQGEGASDRLRLFESVREYALDQLEDPAAPLRMARYFADAAARHAADLRTRQARTALAWLARERDNLLAAHDALIDAPSPQHLEVRVDLLLAVDPVIARLGPGGAHLDRLHAALERASEIEPARLSRARIARARVFRDRGDMAACVRDLEAARENVKGGARALARVELGETWLAQGRFDDALSELEIALREAQSWNDERTEQRARSALGLLHLGRGLLDGAHAHYLEALDLASELGDVVAESQTRRDLGTLSLMRGQHHRARAYYEEALARAPFDDLRLEGVVRGNLAIIDQEQGRLDDALANLRRALVCLRAVADRPFEAHLLGYLGAVHHERGQLDLARDAYTQALEVLRDVRDVRLEGIFLAARAAALSAATLTNAPPPFAGSGPGDSGRVSSVPPAESARIGQARNDLELALRRVREVGDPALVAAVAAHGAQVSIAEGLREATVGDRQRLRDALEEARGALEEAKRFKGQSDDARFAMRMLERAVPAEQLEIGPSGVWFRVPGRSAVDLASRPTLARLLDALALARTAKAGASLEMEELIAAGWPGERMLPKAAENRVRVAITTLRNLGLRGVLLHREGGHLLDGSIPISRSDAQLGTGAEAFRSAT